MKENVGPYQVIDLPRGRRIWINALGLSGPTYWMYGLLEVDVTVPRQRLAEYKARMGETLSLSGYLVYCLAQAIDENKEVQAYRKGQRQLILFDDVNVGMMVENNYGDKSALMGINILGANHKTYLEIHQEIRTAQTAPPPPNRGMPRWFRAAMTLPWPLSKLVRTLYSVLTRRDPTVRIAAAGTVFVTAVGMFGKGHSGWGITTTPHSLGLVVGSIAWKPAVVDGRIEPRELLSLTVCFDHEVIDGAPATRFVRRLVDLIESGSGLEALGGNQS